MENKIFLKPEQWRKVLRNTCVGSIIGLLLGTGFCFIYYHRDIGIYGWFIVGLLIRALVGAILVGFYFGILTAIDQLLVNRSKLLKIFVLSLIACGLLILSRFAWQYLVSFFYSPFISGL